MRNCPKQHHTNCTGFGPSTNQSIDLYIICKLQEKANAWSSCTELESLPVFWKTLLQSHTNIVVMMVQVSFPPFKTILGFVGEHSGPSSITGVFGNP